MYYTPCILFHTFLWSGKQEHDICLSLILYTSKAFFSPPHSPYECTDFLLNMSDTELGNPGGGEKKEEEEMQV